MSQFGSSAAFLGERRIDVRALPAIVAAAGAGMVAGVLVAHGMLPEASACAVAPLLLLLHGRHQLVASGVLVCVAILSAFGRDFAYIRIGPMYIMDVTLAAALVYLWQPIRRSIGGARELIPLVAIIAIVVIELAFRRSVTLDALRQSVIGLYALWAFVGFGLVQLRRVEGLAKALYLGAIGGTLVFGLEVVSPQNAITATVTPKLVPAAFSLYLGFALLLFMLAPGLVPRARERKGWTIALALVQLGLLVAGGVRSIWVAFLAAVAIPALLGMVELPARWRVMRVVAAAAAALIVVALVAPSVTNRVTADVTSIYSFGGARTTQDNSLQQANSGWRIYIWRKALKEAAQHPLDGIGFGIPLVYDPIQNADVDPHNSFVAIATRLGFPTFALVVLFEVLVIANARRLYALARTERARQLAVWLLAAQILTTVHACFTVVLEGPYMGLFFWLFGGLIIASARAAAKQNA